MIRKILCFAVSGALLAAWPAAGSARRTSVPAFDHLQSAWSGVTDYSMDVDAHEVLGENSADSQLHFAFKTPDRARLDVVAGNNSGSSVTLGADGETVTGYMRAFPVFRKKGGVRDKDFTSLRGNGLLMLNVSSLIACFGEHRRELRQIDGPTVDGEPTDEVVLPYEHVTCLPDADNDHGTVTLDVIDIARDTGYVVMRKRYAGNEVVERWQISDYKVNTGIGDDQLN